MPIVYLTTYDKNNGAVYRIIHQQSYTYAISSFTFIHIPAMLFSEVIIMQRLTPRSLAMCALFATLIMVGAMIRIPLPYIPFTLQTLFVFLSGLILGPALGLTSATLYLIAGLIGLPVFTNGGGLLYVLQPTFGYILAFCPATYVIGYLAHKRPSAGLWYIMLCCFAGVAIIYILGVAYYVMIARLYLGQTISIWQLSISGALVFLPKDALICFTAAYLYKRLPPSLLPHTR